MQGSHNNDRRLARHPYVFPVPLKFYNWSCKGLGTDFQKLWQQNANEKNMFKSMKGPIPFIQSFFIAFLYKKGHGKDRTRNTLRLKGEPRTRLGQ